jgi:hypothetical protein
MPNRFKTNTAPPPHKYKTAPYPYPSNRDNGTLYNLQICVCGHDRLNHSEFLGHGKKRVIITNCCHAGHCSHQDCDCEKFMFSAAKSSQEGRKRRAQEEEDKTPVPPKAKPKS